ncbi:pyridine nucleotide-disulfide oxidoreductase [Boudabousia tangfeifanii]|uniref:Pyridine nucleotide-disulfide oxidoreductase n=1 Tax=Boudabousia tangfeifanii TaxID=1912795 RepID=A0A1D9MM69_9ACTO|nr:FAD-dependent oxidoreductase [Boudabousia tangfeifanii]AOZ73338.1 pyridine nucleotide-disulfide oxidoreductase [Boudabousia tangfeifanii]
MEKFDLIVIGFGKAGKTLAGAYANAGHKVAMVERSDQMYGGTCINIGCVPTKALVHRAETFAAASDNLSAEVDGAKQFAAATTFRGKLTDKMRAANLNMLESNPQVTVITGLAKFTGPKTVEVSAGNETLELSAENIVINTGAVSSLVPIPGLKEAKRVITSTEAQMLETRPAKLAVIGGGPIGAEFASLFATFGTEVLLLEAAPKLFGRSDDDVAEAAVEVLQSSGVKAFAGVKITEVTEDDDQITVHYENDGQAETFTADYVLAATGRRPAIDDLNLEAAGIETTERGAVKVDDHLRTNVDGVWAVGDVNGGPQFTYISLDDFRIVLDQLTGEGQRSTADRKAVPNTIYLSVPLASVGMTEKEAREAGKNIKVGTKPTAAVATMPWAKIVQQPVGLLKFVIDADSDQILGAQLLMPNSHEVINLVALAMRYEITATQLAAEIYTHPSATEGIAEVISAAK